MERHRNDALCHGCVRQPGDDGEHYCSWHGFVRDDRFFHGRQKMINWPHFSEYELKCHCGCNVSAMAPAFMRVLEAIRVEYDRPMIVTSAYRCGYHNANVSTTGHNGPHTTGRAVDVLVSGSNYIDLFTIARKHGITGFGSKQHGPHSLRFLHLDTLGKRGWTYG